MNLLHLASPISVVLRAVALIILLLFCIPLQIKEANVKNGLRGLRIQLLSFGIILFLTNIFSLIFLLMLDGTPQRPLNAMLQVGNAVAFLVLSIIGHAMYHRQYSEKNKETHKKIEQLEKRRATASQKRNQIPR